MYDEFDEDDGGADGLAAVGGYLGLVGCVAAVAGGLAWAIDGGGYVGWIAGLLAAVGVMLAAMRAAGESFHISPALAQFLTLVFSGAVFVPIGALLLGGSAAVQVAVGGFVVLATIGGAVGLYHEVAQ